jgi:hypothetical protein
MDFYGLLRYPVRLFIFEKYPALACELIHGLFHTVRLLDTPEYSHTKNQKHLVKP